MRLKDNIFHTMYCLCFSLFVFSIHSNHLTHITVPCYSNIAFIVYIPYRVFPLLLTCKEVHDFYFGYDPRL